MGCGARGANRSASKWEGEHRPYRELYPSVRPLEAGPRGIGDGERTPSEHRRLIEAGKDPVPGAPSPCARAGGRGVRVGSLVARSVRGPEPVGIDLELDDGLGAVGGSRLLSRWRRAPLPGRCPFSASLEDGADDVVLGGGGDGGDDLQLAAAALAALRIVLCAAGYYVLLPFPDNANLLFSMALFFNCTSITSS